MENQRIRLSKSMLKNALLTLLKEKPIDKITIYELCKEAQINRTTFYKYYGNQYDLLEEIETDYFTELENCLSCGQADEYEGLLQALQFLDKQLDVWRILINTIEDQEFTSQLYQLPMICQLLNSYINAPENESIQQYIYIFICQGCYAILRQWMNQEERESPEVITKLILSLCKNMYT